MIFDRPHILWRHTHPSPPGRSALAKDMQVDLLIIGGGFTGCSAALEAARNGASVALLEAQTIGYGGSGRNVGLVNAGLWLPPDEITHQLGQAAANHLMNVLSAGPETVFHLIEREGIDCEATRNGTLHLAHAPSGVKALQERYRQNQAIGALVELLDAEETVRRTGSKTFYGALHDPRAGTIQPLAYCRGLAQAAESAGASLFEHSAVAQLHHDGGVWQAQAHGHTVTAQHVLVAANAYQLGIEALPPPQFISVGYCQFATKPLPATMREHILPGGEGCWDTARVMSSLRVDQANRLIIGGVGSTEGVSRSIHARWARRKLAEIYPDLGTVDFEHAWCGKIAMTADHIPKVLAFGANALSVFGYSGRGIAPGTVFGQRAARALLLGETAALPIAVTDHYREYFRKSRESYYALGAALTHAVSPNPLG